jgi:hypothetical protein
VNIFDSWAVARVTGLDTWCYQPTIKISLLRNIMKSMERAGLRERGNELSGPIKCGYFLTS